MGLWDQFVIARSSDPVGLAGATQLATHDGWSYSHVPFDVDLTDAVEEIASRLGVPAIGAFVADSDAAAIVFAAPETALGWLAINRSYDDSDDGHTHQWLDPSRHHAAVEALATWSATHAPRASTATEIAGRIVSIEDDENDENDENDGEDRAGERHVLFAEDALRVVFQDCLGFATLDDTIFAVDE